MSQQPYYVPESSKLPFAMAITMLVFIIGAANTVIDLGKDTNSYLILVASMLMLWVTMYFWFKQVMPIELKSFLQALTYIKERY